MSASREELLFQLALMKPAAERAEFLKRECAEDKAMRARIESLLAAQAHGVMATPFGSGADCATLKESLAVSPEEALGQPVGRYRLLEKIGEGGFGVVYVSEQKEPVKRRVALKIIKLGMDTRQVVARFEAERQALAMMDHPNIAKVLDAGATDTGRPYFVMELVRGVKLTEYCDQNKLPTRERLELFIKVCQAIQHAHQKGIIHRDIKPSNILVTLHDGVPVPKVIDFGIAKATQQELTDKTVYTQLQQFIGTPAYMSPEQAEMSGLDVDTRSDIYSLGVLLYELLTGSTPFDTKQLVQSGVDEMRKIIREREPVRPSTRVTQQHALAKSQIANHKSQIPSDLDWIVMKCLEKDRTRRYETANGLAFDLKRHLNDEPVLARPPSAVYRLQKAWRRQRAAFAVVVLIALVLVVATAVSAWQAAIAKRRLAESEAVSKFLTELFQSPDPARNGHTVTVAEILAAAAKKLESDLADQPARRNEFQATLARTYHGLGLYREAIPLLEKVRDYDVARKGRENPGTLQAMFRLAVSYDSAGRCDEALKLQEQVLALSRKVLGPKSPETLRAMNRVAHGYFEVGRGEQALKMREEVLALQRQALGPEAPDTIQSMNGLAESYFQAGRKDEALKMREEELALCRKVRGPEDPYTVLVMLNLVVSYDAAGRRDEALNLAQELVTLSRRTLGPQHPRTLHGMATLANCYFEAGRREDAMALLEKACEIDPQNGGPFLTLATWQAWLGRDSDYEATRRRLVQQAEGTDQAETAASAAQAFCLRPSTNAVLLTKVLNLAQKAVELGNTDARMPSYQFALGLAEYRNGQFAAAERTLTIANQAGSTLREPEFPVIARLFCALCLFRRDKLEEARSAFRLAEAQMPPLPKDDRNPIVDGRTLSENFPKCWMAYKEAKSLLFPGK